MQHNITIAHKLDAMAIQIFRQTETRTAKFRRRCIGWFLIGIVLLLPACTSSESAGVNSTTEASPAALSYATPWPVSTADSEGRVLQLSKTTVTPGEIITRTVTASRFPPDMTSAVMTLEQDTDNGWQTISDLGLLPPLSDFNLGPNGAIPAAGITTAAQPVRIPNVLAGNYRVRQDMSYGEPPISITLYAPLQVTTSATPSP